MKTLTIVIAALTAFTALSTSARAQSEGTAQQRMACTGDAFRFCASDIPNVGRIESCLMQNMSRLSSACQAQFQQTGDSRLQPEHFRRAE